MKTYKFVILIFSINIPFITSSQDLIGVYCGYNRTYFHEQTFNSLYNVSFDTKNRCIAGFNFKFRRDNPIDLTFGLDYQYRFTDIKTIFYGENGISFYKSISSDIHSINLRVLPEIWIGDKYGVYLNVGPYIGYIFRIHNKGEILEYSFTKEMTPVLKGIDENYQDIDYGLSFAIGAEIPFIDKLRILTEISYCVGKNAIDYSKIDNITESFKINSLYIKVGIIYDSRKLIIKNYRSRWASLQHGIKTRRAFVVL